MFLTPIVNDFFEESKYTFIVKKNMGGIRA